MSKKSSKVRGRKKFSRVLIFLLFVVVNVVVIALAAQSEFGNATEAAELATVQIQIGFLLPAFLCFALAVVLEIGKYVLTMLRLRPRYNFRKAWQVAKNTVLFGHYYDNITPAAIGGQPYQIYYMRKNSHLPSGIATAIPVVGMISSQIGFLLVAVVCFVCGQIYNNPVLMVPAWLGLLFYAFWPVLLLGTSFFPKTTARLLNSSIKLLAQLRIIKHPGKIITKIEKEVKNYSNSVALILRSRGLFVQAILLSVVYQLLIGSIPFFVLAAFGGPVNYFESLATTIAVMSAVCFVPTPGNAGAAEGAFFVVFSALSQGYVFWAMLVWRFFSYYSYLLLGLLTYLEVYLEKKCAKIKNSLC